MLSRSRDAMRAAKRCRLIVPVPAVGPSQSMGGATGAQTRGHYRPRRWARPSQGNQATKPPLTRGLSGRVRRTLCTAILKIPGLVQQPDRLTRARHHSFD
jgi:hypothetical protein